MASAIEPLHAEGEIALSDDFILRMKIDFRMIDRLEGLLNKGMDEALRELGASVSMAGKFLWAMTRDDHSALTFDQIAAIVVRHERREAVQALLGKLVAQAFNIGEGEQSRPPRAARAKRSSGTSSASSRNGARRGSGQRTSGKKPRARS